MDYSFPKLLETLAKGNDLAVATLVEAGGSTPQVVGATAIFSPAGLVAGTVGGGLLEAKVEAAARRALADRTAHLLPVRLDADPSDMEGAICGGAASVLVDPEARRDREVFAKALSSVREGRPGYLATEIRGVDGPGVSTRRQWLPIDKSWHLNADLSARDALGLDDVPDPGHPLLHKHGTVWTLVELVQPLPRLVVAGAGHVGRAVARLGRLLDFSVTVIDDRAEFADAANIPEADEILVGPIGETVAGIEGSPDDYFVIVTRGHQKDAEALRAVLGKPAAYVGMIGSRNKTEVMRREFLRQGWAGAEAWARVHAPIGLDIGSRTVDEIAVSIAAELVAVRSRRRDAGRRPRT
jgi:xanthine dehydrogenase accessory factor